MRTAHESGAGDAENNNRAKALGSLTMNDDALSRLMVTEMRAQEKEER
ncbi:hypothetical protein Tco_0623657, partial [Tanacetum coccineum]